MTDAELQPPPRITDPDFDALAEHIRDLLEKVEQLPFPNVQADTFELLNCLDLLHRESLSRLLEVIEAKAPALMADLSQDFAIRTLLMLYNFLPEDAPPSHSEAAFIPLDQVTVTPAIQMPIWIPGGNIADFALGSHKSKQFEDMSVLLCNVDNKIYALQNKCLESILPLEPGRLEGHLFTCPWHNCQYDVRTGEIQNQSGLRLETYPVEVDERGRFSVGFNV